MLQDFTSTLRGIVLKCLENIKRDYLRYINPPAPKVLRRGSLAVDATGQICQTGTIAWDGSYFACGGKMRQSLVAVRTFIFFTAASVFFTAAGDCCFCVAGAAFQGLIACGGKITFLFSIACGGKKSIARGGKWVSLMPGYIKPIACGSKLLCSTCAHTCLLSM